MTIIISPDFIIIDESSLGGEIRSYVNPTRATIARVKDIIFNAYHSTIAHTSTKSRVKVYKVIL